MSKLRTTIGLGILVALSASVLGFSAGPPRSLAVATGGDTCTSPTPITSLPYNDTGDTSSATNQMLFLGTACVGGGASSRPGPDLIYSFTVAGGNSLTFTVTPSQTGLDAYDPAIYILGACGTGSSCVHAADNGSYGEPETIGPITLAPGTYYFYVDSVYSFEEPGVSGPYSLSVTGSLGASAGSRFYTLTPCRLIDTRNAPGPSGGPALTAATARTFPIAGLCGVPPGAKAVSINATIALPTAAGYLTVFPGGPLPEVSLINFRADQIRANNGIVPLAGNGTITVFNGQGSGSTHFILDVNGYFQ